MQSISKRISSKLEEGDYKGAVRLACSEDTFAEPSLGHDRNTEGKNIPPPSDYDIPMLPPSNSTLEVTHEDVVKGIRSFPKGTAGGLDLLRPQHLLDMTSPN